MYFLEWNSSWILTEKTPQRMSKITKIAKKLFSQQEHNDRDQESDLTKSSSKWNVNTAILVQNNLERHYGSTLLF